MLTSGPAVSETPPAAVSAASAVGGSALAVSAEPAASGTASAAATSLGRYSRYAAPTLSSACRMARRSVAAVNPAVSRYTGTIRPAWSRAEPSSGWNSGLSNVVVKPRLLTRPLTTILSPSWRRLSMYRRPNHVASTSPVSSPRYRSEEHTSELQSRHYLVCRLLLEK